MRSPRESSGAVVWLVGGVLLAQALSACSGGASRPDSSTPDSPAATSAGRSNEAPAAVVTSTLDRLTALPHRVHWEAATTSAVDHVDFIIDGQIGWTEHNAPYFYGDDGNWLVTSFLTPGKHTFVTKVTTTDGQTAETTTTAAVGKAPSPPAVLAGTWTRVVTAADVKKQTSGQPPPTGAWTLTFNSVGMLYRDPLGGGVLNDVAYPRAGRLIARPITVTPDFPVGGGFCADVDPEWAYAYSVTGKTLTLHALGKDVCGDRAAVTEGTWTRAP